VNGPNTCPLPGAWERETSRRTSGEAQL
jgi:hypothetical protein